MTQETLTNPLFIAALFAFLVFASWAIATAISALMDRAERKKLDAITAKYAARKAADDAHHAAFMAQIDKIENCDWNRLDLLTDATKAYRLALKAKYGEDSERLCNKMDRLTSQFARINKIEMPLAERIRDSHHFVPA
mgnify:CR=1 FL=1